MHLLIKILIIFLFFFSNVVADKPNYFEEGKIMFDSKKLDKSKIYFEKSIVFNPKDEKSYLYLAKIFNSFDNNKEEEINLNNVLLLNPKNEEAIYMFILLKIKQFNYDEAKKLINEFNLVCDKLCLKKDEIQVKFNKLEPENEKSDN